MKNQVFLVTSAIEQAINGEAAPKFASEDFKELMSATTSIISVCGSDPFKQALFESIGRRTVLALLDRLNVSMQSERALAIMRDDNIKPM